MNGEKRDCCGDVPNSVLVKIETYAPQAYLEPLLEELTKAGACRVGNYDHVAAITPVQGVWRPLPGSCPYQGQTGKISREPEFKLEFPCPADRVEEAVAALKRVHPYEEPVIYILPAYPFS